VETCTKICLLAHLVVAGEMGRYYDYRYAIIWSSISILGKLNKETKILVFEAFQNPPENRLAFGQKVIVPLKYQIQEWLNFWD